MFKGKRILITGGTGSLGRALARRLLDEGAESIRIYSRNENNQVKMKQEFDNDPRIRCLIGDVRDKDRLTRAGRRCSHCLSCCSVKTCTSD